MQPEFLIIGDSHSSALRQAANQLGISCAGGFLVPGRFMNDYFFRVRDGRFELLDTSSQWGSFASSKLERHLLEAGGADNFFDLKMPILSTIGFNTHNFVRFFNRENLTIEAENSGQFLSEATFGAAVKGARRGGLEFYRTLTAMGKTVYAVPSPHRFPNEAFGNIFRNFERVMLKELSDMGVGIVDVRAETTDKASLLLPKYVTERPGDAQHGNAAYGAVVLQKFLAMLPSRSEKVESI
jgi:hypothetical protein